MPLATPQQYGEMMDAARAHRYAYPAVNVSSSSTLNAALRGFAEAGSDGIVQVSTGGGDFLSGDTVREMARGALLLAGCDHLGVVLEIECGIVGGEEDGVSGDQPRERLYTTLDDLLAVAASLGTGEKGRYLTAATFGNVHGVYKPGNVKLRPSILREGQKALAAAYGPEAHFDFVFHGGSGSTPEEIEEAVSYGTIKMNLGTDLQYAYTHAVAEAAMAERIARACEEPGSAGRSIAPQRGGQNLSLDRTKLR